MKLIVKDIKVAIQEQQSRVWREEEKLAGLKARAEGHHREKTVRLTNEDLFKDFIENEHSTVVAFTRVMLMDKAEQIIASKEQVIEQHKKSLVSGEYVIHIAERILATFGVKE